VTVSSEKPMPQTGGAPQLPERLVARLADLDALGEAPLEEHPDAYQRLHAELQEALAEIESA
jgi:hypothetical protein